MYNYTDFYITYTYMIYIDPCIYSFLFCHLLAISNWLIDSPNFKAEVLTMKCNCKATESSPTQTNMTMENPPWMKMYFLLKIGDFPASHISSQGCKEWQLKIANFKGINMNQLDAGQMWRMVTHTGFETLELMKKTPSCLRYIGDYYTTQCEKWGIIS